MIGYVIDCFDSCLYSVLCCNCIKFLDIGFSDCFGYIHEL